MPYNNHEILTLKAGDGHMVRVRLEVNARARRLIIRLDERRREAVAIAPHKGQIQAAAAFAAERIDWISTRLRHLPTQETFREGMVFNYRGNPCRITCVGEGRTARFMPAGIDGTAQLSVPGEESTIAMRVERFLKRQARAELGRAVISFTGILGVGYKGITIKDTRSRWGSCTSTGQLSFSWRLILAPDRVLEYVAAHECAHLLEMNHSRRFWAHVERCCPDWRAQRAWLRAHGAALQTAGG